MFVYILYLSFYLEQCGHMDQVFSNNDVVIMKQGNIGRITLNRPKSLNSLNLDMIREITIALDAWGRDDSVKAVFMDGNGDRAFCAGGDIKGFYKAGMDYRRGNLGIDVAMLFFREEYELNSKIFSYSKPIIAHMHGITMGGGFGLAGNARFRLVAPDTAFAMPEAKIGFFPDVGSMYHLKRLPHHMGLYMALTGNTISASDMLFCDLACGLLQKKDVEDFLGALSQSLANVAAADAGEAVEILLQNNCYISASLGHPSEIMQKSDEIEKVFEGPSVVDIINAAAKGDGLIKEAHQVMQGNSPFSMCLAFKYYYRECLETFADIIEQDLILATNFAKGRDFYEGIRAAVIDKDRSPKWEEASPENVEPEVLERYFLR